MRRPPLIAIDGPGAVGKNAVGSLLAKELGYRFLDTGAMYRALTWLAINRDIDLEDEETLSKLAAETAIDLAPPATKDEQHCSVSIDRRDVTDEVRYNPDVEAGVSLVAKVAGVRQALVTKQRLMAQGDKVVMVGRDIGTVVLPQAELKIYLVASPEERAQRRYLELVNRGQAAEYASVLGELKRRDNIDSQRAVSPLQPAQNARIVNTNGLDLEEVLAKILALVEED